MRINRLLIYLIILFISAGWTAYSHFKFPVSTVEALEAPWRGFFAPKFLLLNLENEETSLSELAGAPIIVNFWASWCTPCITEAQALQNVYTNYAPKGLVLLGVNMTQSDSLSDVENFIAVHGITFPILLDVEGRVGRLYHVQALPTTFFISKDGRIQDVVVGGPMSDALLESKAIQLLAEMP
ncbi:MAG: TlpA family protein disulfide reductase [Anaerolineaceae bacterium]|nr:TlpA family protein disulfide reductase [Anaerolineaceae bacterium]